MFERPPANKVVCNPALASTPEMFEWLRSQDPALCRPMDDTNVAFYLDPKLYLLWKLKWAQ